MPRRTGWYTLGLVAVAVVGWGLWPARSDPVVAMAERLFGERWYAVMFRHTPIGHYRAWTGRSKAGHFEFLGTLRFGLEAGKETRMEDRLVFHKEPPHALLRATHTVAGSAGRQRNVVLEEGAARVEEGGVSWMADVRAAANASECAEALQCDGPCELTMRQYLGIEMWLATGGGVPGAQRCARSVDLERLAYAWRRWRVTNVADGRVDLAKVGVANAGAEQGEPPTHVAPVRVALDEDSAPAFVDLGGRFALRRVANENTAKLWQRGERLFADENRGAAVDRRIREPGALKRLVLAVEAEDPADVAWLNMLVPLPEHKSLTILADAPRPAMRRQMDAALAPTAAFPALDAQLVAMAANAVGGATEDRHKADALVRFVHGFLRYEDVAAPLGVPGAVRERCGDCTEFADVLTTLARAAGLPARTVAGLAYRPTAAVEGSPWGEFALHAWNEVAIDGVWHGVDPTAGQTRLAATHIPLPPAGLLAAAVALPHVTFRVVEAHY